MEKFPFLKEFNEFTIWSFGEKSKQITTFKKCVLVFSTLHPNLPSLEYDEEMSNFENQLVLMFQCAKYYFNRKK